MSTIEDRTAASPFRITLSGWSYLRIAWAMLERDVSVLIRMWPFTVARVTMQPLLFVFVFAYVFPLVGQGVGGTAGSTNFASLLVPGTLAMTLFLNGIQAVTIPMVTDLGSTREIEDRASCPLPLAWLAGEKVLAGAIESFIAAPLVAVLAYVLPSRSVHVDINWPVMVPLAVLVSIAGAALGLFLGVVVRPSQVQAMFTVLVLPMTFLGASYYPWVALNKILWLKVLTAINPLVYANESLRAVMAPQIPHLNLAVSTGVLIGASTGLFVSGVLLLRKRLTARSG